MLGRLKNLFVDHREEANSAAIPPGQRVYAVGDVHGRRDLLETLIEAIEDDDRLAGLADTTVIMLGDLVDRGPDSKGVIDLVRDWQQRRRVRVLAGNHEEMFLESFVNEDVLRHFLRHGGRETVLSFGLDPTSFRTASLEEVQALMAEAVPAETREYIAAFEDWIEIGDYLFVHAGIDPGVPIDEQSPGSLRWIREPFLSHTAPFPKVVVHGHTINERVQDRGNRIGIDTGAFSSGRLTALVLEDTQRRYLETSQNADGTIVAMPKEMAA